jgi:hypothetical protein
MAERVKLKHVQFDTDFFEKPKMEALAFRFGADGVLLYMAVLFAMGEATDGELDTDNIRAKAQRRGWDSDRTESFIAYLLEREMIHQGSKPFLVSNRRIQEDQESLAAKQRKWRAEKRIPTGNALEESRNPSGNSSEDLRIPTGSVNTELLKSEDLKNEDLKTESLTVPGGLDSPELRKAITMWAKAQRIYHNRHFGQFELEAMLMQHGSRPVADLIRNIIASASARAKSVFEAPLSEKEKIEIASAAKAKAANGITDRPRPKELPARKDPPMTDEQRRKAMELLKSCNISKGAA